MAEIIIKLPDRPETVGRLVEGVYRVGRSPAAHIQISRPEVSGRHAILTVRGDTVFVADAGSTSGTYVDGARVGDDPVPVPPGCVIHIGEATLTIRDKKQAKPAAPGAAASPQKGRPENVHMLSVSGIPFQYRKVIQGVKRKIHDELLNRMNLKNLTLSGANYDQVREQAGQTIQGILADIRQSIPGNVDIQVLEKELINEAVALGPLEDLLEDPDVSEIMVNGAGKVYIEKSGNLYRTDLMFADDNQLVTIIERIVAPIGRRIDESQPLVDARLPDGSRVNAVIPPLAIDGPTLTIRKFSKKPMTVDILVDKHSLSRDMATLMDVSVRLRKSILISGGTGTGKTTLLNIVSSFIPTNERIITIEDAAELRLGQDHVVRLEARPPNIEGRGAITIRDLVRNALRMRPDRIVVGECRGGEALDMLQAMNTGHDGSLTTIHANSTRDALSRLETLVLMAGFDLPLRAIREQIAAAIDVVIQLGRLSDGSRRVVGITEVTGMEGEVITTQELFEFRQQGIDEAGKVIGDFAPCGVVPTYAEESRQKGIPLELSMFNE